MQRVPAPKATLVLVALGGALLLSHPTLLDEVTAEPAVVYAVPSGTGPAATAKLRELADVASDGSAAAPVR